MKIDPSDPSEIPEESLTCDICGQRFETVESLKEDKLSEVKDVELKEKGVDQLAILVNEKEVTQILLLRFIKCQQ